MNNSNTKVFTGKDCILNNSDMFIMGKKCLIITGRSSAVKSGALSDVTAVLDKNGTEYLLFDRISENPLLSACFEAGKAGAEFGAEFVIGIGGGSALDASKAAAFFAANTGAAPEDVFNAAGLYSSLPIIAVPLTAGTGSEANNMSVMTIDGENRKKSFSSCHSLPKYAFLDPKYTKTLDSNYTVSTALDAFCHCIESYLSPKSDDESSEYALRGARDIWKILTERDFMPNADDAAGLSEEDRMTLLQAADYAGAAIMRTGTGFPHPLGYGLSLEKGVPHGKACGAFTGEFIKYNMMTEKGAERLWQFAKFIGTKPEIIAAAIPALADVNVSLTADEIETMVDLVQGAKNFSNSPYILSRDEMIKIMKELQTEEKVF